MAQSAGLLRPRRGPRLRPRVRREGYEPETGTEEVFEARRERDQGSVRRLPTSRRARRDEIDDIFADDEPIAAIARTLRPVGNGGSDVQVHLVIPRNFNDAQQVADQFKRSVPVILNLQTTDHELSKRMIDFCSGPHLRAGRRHAADRREDLPADAAQCRGLGRGKGHG